MKILFITCFIVCGACFACFGMESESQRDLISISAETTSENNEKTDTDEGIIQYPQLMVYSLFTEIVNPYLLELIHHVSMPEFRPPRVSQLFY